MAEKTVPADLKNEVAAVASDPYSHLLFGDILPMQDSVLRQQGGYSSEALRIYDELKRDTHVASVLDKRELALVKRPWIITAASDAPLDQAASDLVTANLQKLPFNHICRQTLDATLKGFSVGEIQYGYDPLLKAIVATEVIARNQRRFVFNAQRELRMLTREQMTAGVEVPDMRFIVHTFGGIDGSPYGLGLGHSLFWPVLFKRKDVGFWLTFLDKYGAPTAVGKYRAGSSEDQKNTLLRAINALSSDLGIIIPEGMAIEFVESKASGSNDGYENLVRYLDEEISLRVLGETMSSNAQSSGLGSGQAKVHDDVRLEVAQADSELLCSTLNRTLITWITELNYPSATPPVLSRDFSEPEDLTARSMRDKTLRDMGADFTQEYITEIYGDGVIWTQGQPKPQPPGFPGTPEAEFAERLTSTAGARAAQLAIGKVAEQLAARAPALLKQRLEIIQTILDETGDMAAFSERLTEIANEVGAAEFVETMTRAGFAAHLAGRMPGG